MRSATPAGGRGDTSTPQSHTVELCPWCIANGTAYERFGATFNDLDAGASPEATAEVEQRTPGFVTWQDWYWPVRCGDATLYLGQPGAGELRSYPDAWAALREEVREYDWGADDVAAAEFIDGLDPERSAVAYLFRCLVCGTHLARWDMD